MHQEDLIATWMRLIYTRTRCVMGDVCYGTADGLMSRGCVVFRHRKRILPNDEWYKFRVFHVVLGKHDYWSVSFSSAIALVKLLDKS